jgi:hypothetical protein
MKPKGSLQRSDEPALNSHYKKGLLVADRRN